MTCHSALPKQFDEMVKNLKMWISIKKSHGIFF